MRLGILLLGLLIILTSSHQSKIDSTLIGNDCDDNIFVWDFTIKNISDKSIPLSEQLTEQFEEGLVSKSLSVVDKRNLGTLEALKDIGNIPEDVRTRLLSKCTKYVLCGELEFSEVNTTYVYLKITITDLTTNTILSKKSFTLEGEEKRKKNHRERLKKITNTINLLLDESGLSKTSFDFMEKEEETKQKSITLSKVLHTSTRNLDNFNIEDNETIKVSESLNKWILTAKEVNINSNCTIIANGVHVIIDAELINNINNLTIDISGECIDENGSVEITGNTNGEKPNIIISNEKCTRIEPKSLRNLPENERNRILQEKALSKLKVLQTQIKVIVDNKSIEDEIIDAINTSLTLFVSNESIMEVSKLYNNGKEKITPLGIETYLHRLKNLPSHKYDKVEIHYDPNNNKINNTIYLGNNEYSLKGSFCQRFKGFKNGKLAYYDYTIKTVNFQIIEQISGPGELSLSIKITKVIVDGTNRTGCY